MPLILGKDGINRELKENYLGVGGVNQKQKEIHLGVGGVNKKVYASETILFSASSIPTDGIYRAISNVSNIIDFRVEFDAYVKFDVNNRSTSATIMGSGTFITFGASTMREYDEDDNRYWENSIYLHVYGNYLSGMFYIIGAIKGNPFTGHIRIDFTPSFVYLYINNVYIAQATTSVSANAKFTFDQYYGYMPSSYSDSTSLYTNLVIKKL